MAVSVNTEWFFAFAAVAFLVATTGSDVFASVTIGGQPSSKAFSEHFYWAGVQLIGTLLLRAPFGFLAVIESRVHDRTITWKALALFAIPTLCLIYSYFEGYQAAQIAMLDKRWTPQRCPLASSRSRPAPVVLT